MENSRVVDALSAIYIDDDGRNLPHKQFSF